MRFCIFSLGSFGQRPDVQAETRRAIAEDVDPTILEALSTPRAGDGPDPNAEW